MQTDWDNSAYVFEWEIDGVPVWNDGPELIRTFDTPGYYTITGLATRTDGTTDRISVGVNVTQDWGWCGDRPCEPY